MRLIQPHISKIVTAMSTKGVVSRVIVLVFTILAASSGWSQPLLAQSRAANADPIKNTTIDIAPFECVYVEAADPNLKWKSSVARAKFFAINDCLLMQEFNANDSRCTTLPLSLLYPIDLQKLPGKWKRRYAKSALLSDMPKATFLTSAEKHLQPAFNWKEDTYFTLRSGSLTSPDPARPNGLYRLVSTDDKDKPFQLELVKGFDKSPSQSWSTVYSQTDRDTVFATFGVDLTFRSSIRKSGVAGTSVIDFAKMDFETMTPILPPEKFTIKHHGLVPALLHRRGNKVVLGTEINPPKVGDSKSKRFARIYDLDLETNEERTLMEIPVDSGQADNLFGRIVRVATHRDSLLVSKLYGNPIIDKESISEIDLNTGELKRIVAIPPKHSFFIPPITSKDGRVCVVLTKKPTKSRFNTQESVYSVFELRPGEDQLRLIAEIPPSITRQFHLFKHVLEQDSWLAGDRFRFFAISNGYIYLGGVLPEQFSYGKRSNGYPDNSALYRLPLPNPQNDTRSGN